MTGVVTDAAGTVRYVVQGTWDEQMEYARVLREQPANSQTDARTQKPVFETTQPRVIWKKNAAV